MSNGLLGGDRSGGADPDDLAAEVRDVLRGRRIAVVARDDPELAVGPEDDPAAVVELRTGRGPREELALRDRLRPVAAEPQELVHGRALDDPRDIEVDERALRVVGVQRQPERPALALAVDLGHVGEQACHPGGRVHDLDHAALAGGEPDLASWART